MLETAPTSTKAFGVPKRASEDEAPRAIPRCPCPHHSGKWFWPLVSDLCGLMSDNAGNLVSCGQPHTPLSSRSSSSIS